MFGFIITSFHNLFQLFILARARRVNTVKCVNDHLQARLCQGGLVIGHEQLQTTQHFTSLHHQTNKRKWVNEVGRLCQPIIFIHSKSNFKIYSQLLFNQLLTKFSWKSCCIKISLLSFKSLLSGEIFEEMKSYDCENPRIFPHRIFRAINLTYYMLIFLCVSIRSNPVN